MRCSPSRASSVALASAFALLASRGVPGQQPAPAQFKASADVVMVDVLVARDGTPVPGLTAADFVVRDNGVAQPAELSAVASLRVNLLLALDASGSVRGQPLDHLKAAAKAAVASLRPTDQAALLTFANGVSLAAPWTVDRPRITQAIDAVAAQGGTALADAAFTALGLRQAPGSRTLVLLFTDGDDSSSWMSAADVLDTARRSEAIVYTISLPKPGAGVLPPDRAEQWIRDQPSLYRGALLPVLARETGGEFLSAVNTQGLRDAFVNAVARFNSRYVLTFTPASGAASGWHGLEVQVNGAGLQVTARRGYVR